MVTVDEETQKKWGQAVTCIYFHGRKRTNPTLFDEAQLPFEVWTLEHSVDTLTIPQDAQALPSIQLALADLCRNRKNFASDAYAADHIKKLAASFARLSRAPNETEVALKFLGIGAVDGDTAYQAALTIMQENVGARVALSFSGYKLEKTS